MTRIIKKRNVKLENGQPSSCASEARVELVEAAGVVRALQVRCACGETTVVELEYVEQRDTEPDPR